MNKLLRFFDNAFLKIGVAFAILFTVLYPKLPSIGVTHTWVYIRLEDFIIALLVIIWLIQVIRKKVTLPFPVATPIVVYWVVGLLSLLYSLIFIGPHLANFFPKIAVLEYLRRIEYMILFFVAISTVKSDKDIKDYIKVILATLTGVVIYGFGQRWYILLWQYFPKFFLKYPFCFPSFQTGNEEFAKGIPLCLPSDARITSTFGGHYDLAAYLVLILPVLFGAFLTFKNIFAKIFTLLLTIGSVLLLVLTASRISFVAYLLGISCFLLFVKRKRYILPVILISIVLLMTVSQSTAKRFLETIRLASIVTNNQGQVVGVTESSLPKELQNKISKNPVVVAAPPPSQNLPVGSSFITLPEAAPIKTKVAVVQSKASEETVKQLNLTYGGEEISTISGTFLVQKALVYDISFTTRFQGEWPNAWNAFLRNPLLGSGYSSITLATDSDYFRTLGETGLLGFISFAIIFMYFGILLKNSQKEKIEPMTKYFAFALAGGIIGLFINGTFIDVFEASKVAEPLWMLSGIGAGALLIKQREKIDYIRQLKNIFTSNIMVGIYLLVITGIVFIPSISNFFTADDFTWLRWAGESSMKELRGYFTDAHGFFYRPLDKLIIFILFSISAFQPEGYHIFILILHFLTAFGLYILLRKIFSKKTWSFIGALVFLLLPAHGENVYWLATISTDLCSFFIIFAVISWINFREKSRVYYFYSLILSIFALLSYEMAVIIPVLLIISDIFIAKPKKIANMLLAYIPFIFILPGYFLLRKLTHAISLNGDYSYSLPHFIPNFFGNLLGYIGLFISGEYFLPGYNALRNSLKAYPVIILSALLLLILVVAVILFFKRKEAFKIKGSESKSIIFYGIIFAIVSLLPFIGLGNISERYDYLASAGFIIFFLGIIQALYIYFEKYGKKKITAITWIIILAILLWYTVQVKQEATEWQNAGNITKMTLSILRNKYAGIVPDANVYFVNIPIKKANAWIFPVGLPDALWFIYRDSSPRIYEVKTIKDAREMSKNSTSRTYIFLFDKNNNLEVVE